MDLYTVLASNIHDCLSDYHNIEELLDNFTSDFGNDAMLGEFTGRDIQTLTDYIFDDSYVRSCAMDSPEGLTSKILWDNITEYYQTLHLGDGYVYQYFDEEDYDSVFRLLMDRLYAEYAGQIIYDIVKGIYENGKSNDAEVELSDEEYDEGFEESIKRYDSLKEAQKETVTLEELENRAKERIVKFIDEVFPLAIKKLWNIMMDCLCWINSSVSEIVDTNLILPYFESCSESDAIDHLIYEICSEFWKEWGIIYPKEEDSLSKLYNCTEQDIHSLAYDMLKRIRKKAESARVLCDVITEIAYESKEETLISCMNSKKDEDILSFIFEELNIFKSNNFKEFCMPLIKNKLIENENIIIETYKKMTPSEVELSDEEYDEGFEESEKKHKRRLYY